MWICLQIPVDPRTFVDASRKFFPDATLSLGWTKSPNVSVLSLDQKRYIISYVQFTVFQNFMAKGF
jgi:hypothetical protein